MDIQVLKERTNSGALFRSIEVLLLFAVAAGQHQCNKTHRIYTRPITGLAEQKSSSCLYADTRPETTPMSDEEDTSPKKPGRSLLWMSGGSEPIQPKDPFEHRVSDLVTVINDAATFASTFLPRSKVVVSHDAFVCNIF